MRPLVKIGFNSEVVSMLSSLCITGFLEIVDFLNKFSRPGNLWNLKTVFFYELLIFWRTEN